MKKKLFVSNCLDAASGIKAGGYEVQENKEHLTVPNQSMTIPEILERFARGVVDTIQKEPIYDNTDDFEHEIGVRRPNFDFADATALQAQINQRMAAEKKEAKVKAQPEVVEGTETDEAKPKPEATNMPPTGS